MKFDLEEWRHVVSPMFEVYPKMPTHLAGVEMVINQADDLFVSKVSMPLQLLVHDPKIQKSTRQDYVLFERFHAGGGKGEVGGIEFEAAPARLHLIDMSQRYLSEKHHQAEGVCIPHHLLGFDPSKDRAFNSLDVNTPKGRLLVSAHEQLIAANDAGAFADVLELKDVFIGLVQQFMLGGDKRDLESRGGELPLSLILRDYIASNLHRPDIDASHLMSAFDLSRPTLYRHFEGDGGVQRYIRNARLDRCYFELSGSRMERGRIAAVAARWHFNDPTQFSRLFRERFGVSPSAVSNVAANKPNHGVSDQARIAREWFAKTA